MTEKVAQVTARDVLKFGDDFLTIDEVGRSGLEDIVEFAESFVGDSSKYASALSGKIVATMFFEGSTRTRLSFELAAKQLGSNVLSFFESTSSVKKGESFKDTAKTVEAFGVDCLIVRHASIGASHQVARWVNIPVINAGDGCHAHPTQALIDVLTIRDSLRSRGKDISFEGIKVGILGDVRNSRVARSSAKALSLLGAQVVGIAPALWTPDKRSIETLGFSSFTSDLDSELEGLDFLILLRIQNERLQNKRMQSINEYIKNFSMTGSRLDRLNPEAFIMHPGPMNRGVEISSQLADSKKSLILNQVSYGIPARMAVLLKVLSEVGN